MGGVGGWFRTATGVATPAWGPGDDSFGRASPDTDLTAVLNLFRGRSTVMLAGTGMSTGSGLPDYRGRNAVPRSLMTFQKFTGSNLSYRHYWVCSTVGWNWFEMTRPDFAHLALAEFGHHTSLTGVVTQSVDRLHQTADSESVVDLHGNLACVVCLDYGRLSGRAELQVRLLKLNPEVAVRLGDLSGRAHTVPDGDAEVEDMTGFTYLTCPICGGMFKPNVVYFDENARREVVETANTLFDAVEVLLALSSTLTVMSRLRFARQAARRGEGVITTGDGITWANDLATLHIHGRLEHVLSFWVDVLQAG